jgi:antitoxin (DNA-binding transcriptional repressor) of toxin-antitoxin stability system
MTSINVHEAKTNLSKILVVVEGGQEFLIARAGRVIARLSPVAQATAEPGLWCDLKIADDFDAPDAELEGLFGSPVFPR